VDLINVYPTLADLAGLPAPSGVDGVSLKPLLTDPAHSWKRPAINDYLPGNSGVYTERWHYIRYHDGGEELYNRRQDPAEWVNLAGDSGMAEVTKEMAALLPAKPAADSPRARDYTLDPATVKWSRKK